MSLVERILSCGAAVPLLLLCAGPPLQAAQRTPPEQRILDLTNAERARAGCPAVRLNGDLTRAAAGHSADMAHRDFFGHTGSDGRDPVDRTRSEGFPSRYVGENIAAGGKTADETFRQWMDAAPHRDNILDCAFTELGVGHAATEHSRYHHYWTQELGRP
ncbi:CAP domain-containing protein [Saccharopolyspora shandongensis]|uniref:CAP domain-containing protein n=1 Tax=Saccharopolyspora shandongensis TaxID=418495 RepID=UPI0033DE5102